VPTLTVQDVESIIYDENYLKGCKSNYPITHSKQVGFQEIYPGGTTKDELVAQFGQPNSFSATDQEEEYLYFDSDKTYAYHFYVVNGVVSSIFVNSITETMQNILELYGCPDLIEASALSDEPFIDSIDYNDTYFTYLMAGIWVHFNSYPINYSDIPVGIGFEQPLTLSSFLKLSFDPLSSKLVSFSEAVYWKRNY
jgi:hypothetical protein